MHLASKFYPFLLLLLITILFFYKTFIFGLIPFPGDLLSGNYEPYKSEFIGVPHKGQGTDVLRELYLWKYYSIDSIKKGIFPLWNPYVFSGNTHFANLQSGTLNPANVIFFILPFVDGWTVYIILQYFLVLVFTYFYLREIGFKNIPSLFGSIVFSFCSFLSVWGQYGNIGFTVSFLPFVLFSIEKIMKTKWQYWYLFLIFSLCFSTFSGYIQITIYIYFVVIAYAFGRYFSDRKKENTKLIFIFLSIFASILLSSIQIIPLAESVLNSLRGNYSYSELKSRLLPLESFVTLIAPDFFGNPATNNYFLKNGSILEDAISFSLWGLIFVIYSAFSPSNFYKKFFLGLLIITIISCLSLPPIALLHSIGIPFLSTGLPNRILVIFSFSAAVLSALGIQFFIETKKRKKLIYIIIVFGLILLALWLFTFISNTENVNISKRNLILPTLIFIFGCAALLKKIPKRISIIIILALTTFELFYSFQKFNSFVPKNFIYPKTEVTEKLRQTQGINRVWGYGNANIASNLQIIEKIYGTEGYDPIFPRGYAEFVSASKNGEESNILQRTVVDIYQGNNVNELKNNKFRKRTLDILGVKYILNKNDKFDAEFDSKELKLIWQGKGWQIYENINSLPRIKFYDEFKYLKDNKKIIKKLYEDNFDVNKTLLLSSMPPDYLRLKKGKNSSIEILNYLPNSILLKVNTDTDKLLFISDNYYFGWKAKIDGKNMDIIRANYSFRAVPVLKGSHEIEVYYSPLSFWIGFWITVVTFMSLILVFAFVSIRKYI